jgi:hypothetical protein
MELVKDGTYGKPEDWKAEVTCKKFDAYDRKGCGAEYIIDATDLVLRYFRGTHFVHYYSAVQCEQCEKYTRVHDVPVKILRGLSRATATFDGFSDD